MPLVTTDLPPVDDGDLVWFAMIDNGKPVDCYVERNLLDVLKHGPADRPLDKFAAYRPVFEVMIRELHFKGMPLVVAVEGVSRWNL